MIHLPFYNPLFSVIIPTYNRAKELGRALDSLDSQTFQDYEVIVCDDGSTDGTRHTVEKFNDRLNINHIWEENWGGPARPRNRGISIANGQWICFLDSDDWWYPGKLAQVFKYIHKADVIYHDVDVYTTQRKKAGKRIRGRTMKSPVINELMTRNNGLYNSAFSVKKELVDLAGGVSEDRSLIAGEDLDLWIRLSKLTERFNYIPVNLGAYSLGDDNITEISERQISLIIAVFEKHMSDLPDSVKTEALYYMDYSIGRIKQQLGLENDAMERFKSSVRSKRLSLRMKSLYCILLNHHLCGRSKNRQES